MSKKPNPTLPPPALTLDNVSLVTLRDTFVTRLRKGRPPKSATPAPAPVPREVTLEAIDAALAEEKLAPPVPAAFREKVEALMAQADAGIAEREAEAERHLDFLETARGYGRDPKFRALVIQTGLDPGRLSTLLETLDGYLVHQGQQLLHAKQRLTALLEPAAIDRDAASIEPSAEIRGIVRGSVNGMSTHFRSTLEELERFLAAVAKRAVHPPAPTLTVQPPTAPTPPHDAITEFNVFDVFGTGREG